MRYLQTDIQTEFTSISIYLNIYFIPTDDLVRPMKYFVSEKLSKCLLKLKKVENTIVSL